MKVKKGPQKPGAAYTEAWTQRASALSFPACLLVPQQGASSASAGASVCIQRSLVMLMAHLPLIRKIVHVFARLDVQSKDSTGESKACVTE